MKSQSSYPQIGHSISPFGEADWENYSTYSDTVIVFSLFKGSMICKLTWVWKLNEGLWISNVVAKVRSPFARPTHVFCFILLYKSSSTLVECPSVYSRSL